MHEAQEEAEGSNFIDALLGILIFGGIIYLLNKIFGNKKEKESIIKSNHKKWEEEELVQENIEQFQEEQEQRIEQISLNYEEINNLSSIEKEIELYGMPLSHGETLEEIRGKAMLEEIKKEEEEKAFPKISIATLIDKVKKTGYVDIGLSVKWAAKNIGAKQVYDIGYRFRWGNLDYIENYNEIQIC